MFWTRFLAIWKLPWTRLKVNLRSCVLSLNTTHVLILWILVAVNRHWVGIRSTTLLWTGRTEIIKRIVAAIETPRFEAQRRFVLTGMGGQGKSEICLRVCNEVRGRFVSHCFPNS